jgi:hypothetical protein
MLTTQDEIDRQKAVKNRRMWIGIGIVLWVLFAIWATVVSLNCDVENGTYMNKRIGNLLAIVCWPFYIVYYYWSQYTKRDYCGFKE